MIIWSDSVDHIFFLYWRLFLYLFWPWDQSLYSATFYGSSLRLSPKEAGQVPATLNYSSLSVLDNLAEQPKNWDWASVSISQKRTTPAYLPKGPLQSAHRPIKLVPSPNMFWWTFSKDSWESGKLICAADVEEVGNYPTALNEDFVVLKTIPCSLEAFMNLLEIPGHHLCKGSVVRSSQQLWQGALKQRAKLC